MTVARGGAAAAGGLEADLDGVLERTRDLWPALRGERIFVTGGTGFIGTWLLEAFAHASRALGLGARAVVLTRSPAAFAARAPHLAGDAAIELIEGDVRGFTAPPGGFAFAIHGATDASRALNEERPLEMIDVIVAGTRRVLDLCRERGVRRLLFLSSGAVYGPQPQGLAALPEDHLGGPDPTSRTAAYAEAKRLAEAMCAAAARTGGPETAIARCFAFAGPHLPLERHFAIGNFIRDALRGGPIELKGDGTAVRSYLYAADLAVWLWHILFRAPSARPYNVGSGEAISTADLARRVAGAVAPPPDVIIRGTPVPGAPVDRYAPSVARAAAELGLRPTVGLDEAIRRTIEWNRGRGAAGA